MALIARVNKKFVCDYFIVCVQDTSSALTSYQEFTWLGGIGLSWRMAEGAEGVEPGEKEVQGRCYHSLEPAERRCSQVGSWVLLSADMG